MSSVNMNSSAPEPQEGQPTKLISVPRQVGICLKHLPAFAPGTEHYFHSENVPWQRVISAKGTISPRSVVFLFNEYIGENAVKPVRLK